MYPTIAGGAAQRHITPTAAVAALRARTPDLAAIRVLLDEIDDNGLFWQANQNVEIRSPIYRMAERAGSITGAGPATPTVLTLFGITGTGPHLVAAADDWAATARTACADAVAPMAEASQDTDLRGGNFDRDFSAPAIRDLLAETDELAAKLRTERGLTDDPLTPAYRALRPFGSRTIHQGREFVALYGLTGNGTTMITAIQDWLRLARRAVA